MISLLFGPFDTIGDRHTDLLLDELDITTAVLRKFVILGNTSDVAVPARQCLINRLCLSKLCGYREFLYNLSIDLITNADRNLLEISETVKNSQCYFCCTLDLTAVTGMLLHRTSPYDVDVLLLHRTLHRLRHAYEAPQPLPHRESH